MTRRLVDFVAPLSMENALDCVFMIATLAHDLRESKLFVGGFAIRAVAGGRRHRSRRSHVGRRQQNDLGIVVDLLVEASVISVRTMEMVGQE
jgi:hypothetical protein